MTVNTSILGVTTWPQRDRPEQTGTCRRARPPARQSRQQCKKFAGTCFASIGRRTIIRAAFLTWLVYEMSSNRRQFLTSVAMAADQAAYESVMRKFPGAKISGRNFRRSRTRGDRAPDTYTGPCTGERRHDAAPCPRHRARSCRPSRAS